MRTLLPYGEHRDQVIELSVPGGTPIGVAVLVHGGYWRAAFTRELMEPLASDLLARGWVVANVEYRRVGDGGGVPATLDDVAAAMVALSGARTEHAWPGPVISIGHSVGGQLALLTAGVPAYGLDAVVALAPVTDLIRTRAEGLGEGAAAEFIPQSPLERPEAYAVGSPLSNLPVGRPVLVVHGDADTRVPLAHSTDYVEAARLAGDKVELTVLPGVDHVELIDPERPHWPAIMEWMSHSSP